jgi:putative spermidine/putrescine transport system permease protein
MRRADRVPGRVSGPAIFRRWLLWPTLGASLLLFVLPQLFFVLMSVHRNLGFGRISPELTAANYRAVLTDPFYLSSLGLTLYLSLVASAICVAVGFPTAYVLARARAGVASALMSVLVMSSFVTVVIKVLGLVVILSQNGVVNRMLLAAGAVGSPLILLNNQVGVLIGLVHYTLPLFIMLLFGVIQTIPTSLEEAAEIHGATRWGVFAQILVPLALPGLAAGALIAFNMAAGAFTSAVLLGGGRVLTIPVLIQRKVLHDVDYPIGSALSTVLLLVVFALNVASSVVAVRLARTARVTA